MKTTKKILALVMAIAFVFSLCVFSASAYNNQGYVNVEIQIYGDYAWDIDLDATTIGTYKSHDIAPIPPYTANTDHVYYVPTAAGTQTSALTAADAILAAYLEVYGSYDATQVHYTWYENEGDWGTYFDCYEGIEVDPIGVYYLVDSWYENDEWNYEYLWEGTAWLLSINGVSTSLYASKYALATAYAEFSNTQPYSIVLNYDFVQEDFVTTTYISGAIPLN